MAVAYGARRLGAGTSSNTSCRSPCASRPAMKAAAASAKVASAGEPGSRPGAGIRTVPARPVSARPVPARPVSAGAPLDLAAGVPVLDGVGTELADARGFLAALGRVVTAFGLITSVSGLAVPVTAGVPVSGADAPERRDPRDRVVR